MSETVLYVGGPSGTLRAGPRFRNAWRGAPALWGELAKVYVKGASGRWFNDAEELWGYEEAGGDMEGWARLALRTTYDDYALLAVEAPATIAALRRAHAFLVDRGQPSSLMEQADAMDAALENGATAFAWHQTTVAPSWMYRCDEHDNESYYNPLTGEWDPVEGEVCDG